jgi:hypothetical protein
MCHEKHHPEKTPLPESASELYRPSDLRLSAKLVPTFTDRGCHVASVTDPYGRILGFLDRNIIHKAFENYEVRHPIYDNVAPEWSFTSRVFGTF